MHCPSVLKEGLFPPSGEAVLEKHQDNFPLNMKANMIQKCLGAFEHFSLGSYFTGEITHYLPPYS